MEPMGSCYTRVELRPSIHNLALSAYLVDHHKPPYAGVPGPWIWVQGFLHLRVRVQVEVSGLRCRISV